MNNQFPHNNASGGNGGPPGQELLSICLAGVAAIIGTPYLFNFVGPAVENIIVKAYGSEELAAVMYFASFVLSGVVIFALCRMALWYAIGAIVAFGALRFGGAVAF